MSATTPQLGASTRRVVVGAPAAPVLLALNACTFPGENSSRPRVKGPVTLRLATDWVAGPRGETMKSAIPAFEQQNPGITVQVEAITGDYWAAVNTQFAAGTIQEVVLFEGNFFQNFKDQGAFSPIDAALKASRINMGDYSVVPGIYQDKGKQYGMPFQLTCTSWRYNVDLFQERGVKPPTDAWTWDDMLSAARTLTDISKGQYGVQITNSALNVWAPMLFSAGARWFNANKTKTTIADQGGAEAFQWVVDLIHRHHVSPTVEEARTIQGNSPNAWAAGKIAMQPANLSAVGATVQQVGSRFKWALMPTPKHPGTKKSTQLWSDQPHVLTSTANKKDVVEEATKLILFFAGETTQGRIAIDRGSVPVTKKLQAAGDYIKPPPDNMQQAAKNLADPEIQTPGFIKGWDDWYAAVTDVAPAFTGEVAPQQVLRNAALAADRVLTRIGPQS